MRIIVRTGHVVHVRVAEASRNSAGNDKFKFHPSSPGSPFLHQSPTTEQSNRGNTIDVSDPEQCFPKRRVIGKMLIFYQDRHATKYGIARGIRVYVHSLTPNTPPQQKSPGKEIFMPGGERGYRIRMEASAEVSSIHSIKLVCMLSSFPRRRSTG